MVGKQADRDLDKERRDLRQLLAVLRWERRQREAAEAIADATAAAGPNETDD
jgi:hypothetical protein